MKIRVHPNHLVEIDVPEYLFKAMTADQFMMFLREHIRIRMMDPEWYTINVGDVADSKIEFKRRQRFGNALPVVPSTEGGA